MADVDERDKRHAIMALSSLHIARLHPSQEANYVRLATHHETLSLSYLRTALHDITATNCHAIHATGHLIVKYAFAVPQSQNGLVSLLSKHMKNLFIDY